MARPKMMKDPADALAVEKEETRQETEHQSMDLDNVTMADFGAIPESAAQINDPFEGYPWEVFKEFKDAKGNKTKIYKHQIVALAPSVYVQQDRSGRNQTIGGKLVNLENFHSRMEPSESERNNMEYVFDRKLELKDGHSVHYAIVKDHFARARICFRYDTYKKRIVPDRRYLLADKGQAKRLRRCFEIIINPKLKREQLADSISNSDDQ